MMVYFASVLSAGRINAKTCFVLSQSFFLATWSGIWFKFPVACCFAVCDYTIASIVSFEEMGNHDCFRFFLVNGFYRFLR